MPMIIDPSKMDAQSKKTLLNMNIRESKHGLYKMYTKCNPIVRKFMNKYDPEIPKNICEISVVNEHSLEVVEKYVEKGINSFQTNVNHPCPVVLNIVGRDFTGTNFVSNDEIRDELINLRTSFCNTIGNQSPYPLKEDECVYSKTVVVIRQKTLPLKNLMWPELLRFSMITTSPVKNPKLVENDHMNATDFIKTWQIVESVFQTAIGGKHQILVLTPFGHNEDGNPVNDIIKIYNYCIFKYGYFFKQIIVAIPQFTKKEIYEKYNNNIVRLQELVSEVDSKYENIELENNLKNTSKNKPKKQEQYNSQEEQMKVMYNMMQNNPMMIQMMQNMMNQQNQN